MPTKRKLSRKTVSNAVAAEEKKADKELAKIGLNTRTVTAVVLILIGLVMVFTQLGAVLIAIVGIALIYFGLKVFGVDLKL